MPTKNTVVFYSRLDADEFVASLIVYTCFDHIDETVKFVEISNKDYLTGITLNEHTEVIIVKRQVPDSLYDYCKTTSGSMRVISDDQGDLLDQAYDLAEDCVYYTNEELSRIKLVKDLIHEYHMKDMENVQARSFYELVVSTEFNLLTAYKNIICSTVENFASDLEEEEMFLQFTTDLTNDCLQDYDMANFMGYPALLVNIQDNVLQSSTETLLDKYKLLVSYTIGRGHVCLTIWTKSGGDIDALAMASRINAYANGDSHKARCYIPLAWFDMFMSGYLDTKFLEEVESRKTDSFKNIISIPWKQLFYYALSLSVIIYLSLEAIRVGVNLISN